MKLLFLIALIVSFNLQASSLYPKAFYDKKLTIDTYIFEAEREFNRNGVDIDEVKLKGYATRLSYLRVYNPKVLYEVGMDYLADGYFEEEYKEELDYIPDGNTEAHGFKEPDLTVYYWLSPTDYKELSHALKFYIRPKIFSSKSSRFGNGGTDLEFGYYFDTDFDQLNIVGDIYSKLYGKRETRLFGKLLESTSAYTEVGLNIGASYKVGSFLPKLKLGYASTTEYKTYNKFFRRNSDKGFGVRVELGLGFFLGPKELVELSFKSKSFKFNSIEEEDLSTDVSYELERRSLSLIYSLEVL